MAELATDPTLRADLTVLLDDYAMAGRHLSYELRVMTDMYHAVWHVACEQQREIEKLTMELVMLRRQANGGGA